MTLPFLALLCVGLRVGQGGTRRDEPLPRPSISAWPSSVVPARGNVTLRCSAPTREVTFVLRRGKIMVESLPLLNSAEGLAKFPLTDLQYSYSGEYTCEYYRRRSPSIRSPPSDVLLLLVTGSFPNPSLRANQQGKVTAGDNVTLQCQRNNVFDSNMFALLKKGTATPIQVQRHTRKKTDFSLRRVTVSDTGEYSCVYYQSRAPFWASEPSDYVAICVTDEPESTETAGTGLGTTEIILIATCTLLFLLTAFLVYRYTCCGAALNKMTRSSRSSTKPEEVVTDASPAMRSYSPALDEGPQVSKVEEAHGVTYAELNTRALSEGPSGQDKQPLEPCVYSAIKT
ncbi:T-cell-interacting, activating receptor on myeloid cells protein 1-like [Saccopteryx bilineata]|uniref:T-cell-interacting, activating receptor on myeloid cells protein 1-like n=1 Tax=Saccopteryx bilineata TaxID=59482 RepID=UPI0033906692